MLDPARMQIGAERYGPPQGGEMASVQGACFAEADPKYMYRMRRIVASGLFRAVQSESGQCTLRSTDGLAAAPYRLAGPAPHNLAFEAS